MKINDTLYSPSSYTPSPPRTVSWQTTVWTLIPLSINIMSQPSGRVLSLPSHHSTYLRSSLILCTLDALSFLLRLLLSPLLLQISFGRAFDIMVRERYNDEGEIEVEEVEGIQSLERQTWLRWVFFLLGTLGPAIKLIAMQGVPWTKAWGMMFLFLLPWLVFEYMVFARKTCEQSNDHMLVAQDVILDFKGRRTMQCFLLLDTSCFRVGIAFHGIILLWSIVSIWSLLKDEYDDTMPPVAALAISFVVFYGLIMNCVILIMIAVLMIDWLCGKYPGIGPKLLLTSSTTGSWFRSRDSNLINLIFSLVNLSIFVAWYSLKYNPEGTGNPSWTDVFG